MIKQSQTTMNSDANFKICIPKPCHEDWNKFTPDQKGAFCKVCSKSVHDFTQKTTGEIKTILFEEMSAGKKVCGRFNEDQVMPVTNKIDLSGTELPSLDPLSLNFRRLRKFALALFLVFGGLLFTTDKLTAQKIKMGKVAYAPHPEILQGEVAVKTDPTEAVIDTTKKPVPKVNTCTAIDTVKGTVNMVDSIEKPDAILGDIVMLDPEPTDTVKVDPIIPEDIFPVVMGMIAYQETGPDSVLTNDLIPVVETINDSAAVINGKFAVPESTDVELTTDTEVINHLEERSVNNDIALICYPNPNKGVLNLNYNVKEKNQTSILLYDQTGKCVKTLLKAQSLYAAEYNTQFDISELPNGVYFCELQSGDKKYTKRIILEQ
jgi:hypothetical protein